MRRPPPCLVLLVAIPLTLLGGLLLFAAAAGMHRKGGLSKCSNSLRQLGLAAIQYSDDERFLPHVSGLGEEDGGYTSNHSSKVVRALHWYEYTDDPEGWVCPENSPERNIPPGEPYPGRAWFWGGQRIGDPQLSPFVDGLPDPTLDQNRELSYGWTRRGLAGNVRSSEPLGADKNLERVIDRDRYREHTGWNVLYADASVEWVEAGSAAQDGLAAAPLAIQTPPAQRPQFRESLGLTFKLTLGGVGCLALGVVGLGLSLLRRGGKGEDEA